MNTPRDFDDLPTDSETSPQTPPSDYDEVEDRASMLLARMAAQRTRRQSAPEPDPHLGEGGPWPPDFGDAEPPSAPGYDWTHDADDTADRFAPFDAPTLPDEPTEHLDEQPWTPHLEPAPPPAADAPTAESGPVPVTPDDAGDPAPTSAPDTGREPSRTDIEPEESATENSPERPDLAERRPPSPATPLPPRFDDERHRPEHRQPGTPDGDSPGAGGTRDLPGEEPPHPAAPAAPAPPPSDAHTGQLPTLPPPPPGWTPQKAGGGSQATTPPWLRPHAANDPFEPRERPGRLPVDPPPAPPSRPVQRPTAFGGQAVRDDPPAGLSLRDAEAALRSSRAPRSGWRHLVQALTGGRHVPRTSAKDRDHEDLLERIRRPIVGDFRIAVLSMKGGVGKTTTTLGLGSALAVVRSDRVIAVDANPDRGTLGERVADPSTHSTVRDLLRDPHITRYADVRRHTRMSASRLEVLASEQEPAVAEVFGEVDYRRTVNVLGHFYNVILSDCGTGIMHSAMNGVLDLAHAIVLVSSPAVDAARSASATLDWLDEHGHADLVKSAHVVFSAAHPGAAGPHLDKLVDHFGARCASLHLIPFEPHLAAGSDFDFEAIKPATAQAYLGLADALSAQYSTLRRPG